VQTTTTIQHQSPKVPLALLALIVPVIAAVAIVATGPTWSAPAVGGGIGSTVRIQNFAFAPVVLRVAPGAKVVVSNADSTTHTMSATDGRFDTSNLAPGQKRTITAPETPGRYRFVCRIHPNMVGTLVVSGS
jgi:plastocyanin